MSVALLIIGIVLFIGLVVVHEWGHFIVARRNGVEVEEFGIFFPPTLYRRKTKAGWDFTINALPLGGFVKLKGEHDSDTEPGTFGAASLWVKSKIMSAGVVMNLLTALAIFTAVAFVGMPQLLDDQYTVKGDTQLLSHRVLINYVEPGSPAAKAGLQSTDEITDISRPGYSPVGTPSSDKLPAITKNFAGQTVIVYYLRHGHQEQARMTLLSRQTVEASRKAGQSKGYMGIITKDIIMQRSTWSAPIVAVGFAAQVTQLTFQGLGHAIAGLGSLIAGGVTGNTTARENGQTNATSQVGGPVAVFFVLKSGSFLGFQYMLLIIGIVSLTLAIINILPFPALDGGRLWFTLAARGMKRPMSAKFEESLNTVGIMVLMGLVFLITIVDVKRFF